jgi:RNA 2',3'-cyclic 3'-phosphodiesterase
MRLFVALEMPDAARAALSAFRDAAADPAVWRPVADESLHLTLAFLGNRPDSDVATCEQVLSAAVRGPAPSLRLTTALLLPPRGARVLCADVADDGGRLAGLQASVSAGLAGAAVYVPEKRPFHAHVTVARLQRGARPPRGLSGVPDPEPLAFEGEYVTLFRSQLHRSGSRYEPLVRVRCGA